MITCSGRGIIPASTGCRGTENAGKNEKRNHKKTRAKERGNFGCSRRFVPYSFSQSVAHDLVGVISFYPCYFVLIFVYA